MRLKKIVAGFTALICSSGLVAYMPDFTDNISAAEAVNNNFEVNYDGWYGNSDNVELTAKNNMGFNGTRGMTVTGRKYITDGVCSSKGFYLSGGISYNYSIKVYSRTNEKFRLSLLCIDMETNEETTVQLAEKDAAAGEWTEISAEYTAPENSYEFKLTLTADSLNDFSFDDVKITSEQSSNAVYAATAQKGLKDEFAPYFRVGNILNGGTVKNSEITANIIKDYNSIECENEFKPDSTLVQSQCNGTNIAVSLNNAAAIMDFCAKNNIAMRGHTFVWHSQTPVWFFKENFNANGNWVSSSVMDKRMESYIKNMFAAIKQQYPSLNLYAYDVANECISDDSNRTANFGGAREPGDNYAEGGKSGWVQVYGDNSFVEKAFTYARLYAPEGCDLYYNDYNEYWDHKRDCIYNMCKNLYNKGLLDGVGMQSHVPANATGFAGTDSYIEAMKKYLSIGCDVQITELDISLDSGKYSLQEQADKYKAIFKAAMDWNKNPQSDGRVTLVAIWGPNDANSWLKEGSNALLYDKNNQPKAAYTTLTSMIPQSEWGDGSNYQGGGEVKPIEPNKYGWYFADGFEGDTCGWNNRGPSEIMTSGKTAYVGNEALLVQKRESAWNGASKALNPRAFEPGKEYSFSANVMYFDGDDTDQFSLTLQYKDGTGETKYANITSGTVGKGQWVQLANKNFKIPSDATSMELVIETSKTTNNFYIDEVIGAIGGTTILGAGEYKEPVVTTVATTKATTTITTTKTTASTVVTTKATTTEIKGAEIAENKYFMIKNMNSGQFMEVVAGKAQAGANVQQNKADTNKPSANNVWQFKKLNKDWDLYYIYSVLGDGNTFVLNCNSSENGANISIENRTKTNTMQNFVMLENADGSYTILTRSSYNNTTGYKSCVEIVNASKDTGANVQQWEINGHNCQKWELIPVDYKATVTTTVTTSQLTTTTKVTTTTKSTTATKATTTTKAPTTTNVITTIITTTEPITELIGDINGDGKVNVADVVEMQKYLVKVKKITTDIFKQLDLNRDGKVNVFDFILFKRMLISSKI